jgi:hypothetical protein
MRIYRRVSSSIFLAMLLVCAAVPAWADRGGDDGRDNPRWDNPGRDNDRRNNGYRDNPNYHPPGYVLDNRYRHDRYYPPRGYVVPALPSDHRVIPYRGQNYYFHGGAWYRPYNGRFVVVLPPVGLVVPFLPSFYTTIWIGGLPYYYAGGVYYTWRPEERGYVVAETPPTSEVSELPATPDQLFVYPMKGQSEQQQATDRYQCHRWAADQTGFDPTQPNGNLSDSQRASKRADYQRAMKACLEARGYSVQ